VGYYAEFIVLLQPVWVGYRAKFGRSMSSGICVHKESVKVWERFPLRWKHGWRLNPRRSATGNVPNFTTLSETKRYEHTYVDPRENWTPVPPFSHSFRTWHG